LNVKTNFSENTDCKSDLQTVVYTRQVSRQVRIQLHNSYNIRGRVSTQVANESKSAVMDVICFLHVHHQVGAQSSFVRV
jgi:hypothetical protein